MMEFRQQKYLENMLEKHFPDKRTKAFKEVDDAIKKAAAEKLLYFFLEKEITLEEIIKITGIEWWYASEILGDVAHRKLTIACRNK